MRRTHFIAMAAAVAFSLIAAPLSASAATAPAYTITGHVTLGTHSAAAGDATVTILGNLSRQDVPTDASGNFTYTFPSGTVQFMYKVDNTGPGNYASYYSSPLADYYCSRTTWIDPATVVSPLSITLKQGGEIDGIVSDPSGAPLSDIEVSAQDWNGCVSQDTEQFPSQISSPNTDTAGHYRLTNLSADTNYQISIFDENDVYVRQSFGATVDEPDGAHYSVTAGEVKQQNETLQNGGFLTGSVSCSCDLTTIDPAHIFLDVEGRSSDSLPWVHAYTVNAQLWDSTVRYSANYLPEGTYRVTTSDNYDAGFIASTSPTVTITNGATTTLDVKLRTPNDAVNSFVTALYSDFLNRTPAASEVSGWASAFAKGAPRSAVAAGFVNSDEYRLIRIDAAYQSILGRAGEPQGRKDNLEAMRSGVITTDGIETAFYASGEYYSAHGGTDSSFITAIYSALLHRVAGPSEIASWKTQIQKHSRPWVIQQIWDANETISERVSLMYQKYLGRIPDDQGLKSWVALALQIGDSGLRAGLTGSQEYLNRAQYRFDERVFD